MAFCSKPSHTFDNNVMTSVSVVPTPIAPSVLDSVNEVLSAPDTAAVKRPAHVPDCIVQQRHILAMMGIDVWAQKRQQIVVVDYDIRHQEIASAASLTLNTAPVSASVGHLNLVDDSASNRPLTDLAVNGALLAAGYSDNDNDNDSHSHIHIHIDSERYPDSHSAATQPARDTNNDNNSDSDSQSNHSQTLHAAQQLEQSLLQRVANEARLQKGSSSKVATAATQQAENQASTPRMAAAIQVAAFKLIGVNYHNWVLLVDAVVLKEQSLSQLWNNMLQALSLTPEYLHFPICAGISDKDSAEASVAGFVFRLGKSENVQVAALTAMPDGAQQDTLIRLPYLSEMLADSDKKRQLWQRLSEEKHL